MWFIGAALSIRISASTIWRASPTTCLRCTTRRYCLPAAESEQWIPIYRFKRIGYARVLGRYRLVHAVGTLVSIPVLAILNQNGIVDNEGFSAFVSLALVSCVFLFVVSFFLHRLVGVVSIQRGTHDVIRVGHMTFWGTRRNVIIPVDDVVHLADRMKSKNDIFARLHRYSDPQFRLYMPLMDVEIVDRELFQFVFGAV